MPMLRAFFVRQRGMQNCDFVSEDLMNVSGDGRSQSNFRDQQNGGAAGIKDRLHDGKINRRFSGAGYAVQQHAGKFAGINCGADLIEGGALRWVEIEARAGSTRGDG